MERMRTKMKILQSKKVHTVLAILLCAGIMPITLLVYRISFAYCRSVPLLMHFLLPLCHCVLGALFAQAVKELRCRHLYNILYHSLGAFAFFAYFEWMAPPGLWWLRYCSFIYQIPVFLSAIVFLFFFVYIAIGKRKLVISLSERKLFIAYIAGIVGILFVLPLFACCPTVLKVFTVFVAFAGIWCCRLRCFVLLRSESIKRPESWGMHSWVALC